MIKKIVLKHFILVLMVGLVSIAYAERSDLEEIVVIGSEDEIVKVLSFVGGSRDLSAPSIF